jgi:BTB/POZ domain
MIQVDGTLYRVHRYFFCRDSNEFITRLSCFPVQEQSSPPVISLKNVKTKDFDAFLSVLYPMCVF